MSKSVLSALEQFETMRGELIAWRDAKKDRSSGTSSGQVTQVYDVDRGPVSAVAANETTTTTTGAGEEAAWHGERAVVLVLNKLDLLDECVASVLRRSGAASRISGAAWRGAEAAARRRRIDAIAHALRHERLDAVCGTSALSGAAVDRLKTALRATLERRGHHLF